MSSAYAFFDFDGTLIRGDSLVMLCRYALKNGLYKRGQFAKALIRGAMYLTGLEDEAGAKRAAMSFLAGRSVEDVRAITESFYRERLAPALLRRGVERVKWHRLRGDRVLLVTASPDLYLEPFAREHGLDGVICTRMEVLGGAYTGDISGENCKGPQKALRIAQYMEARGEEPDFEASYAYGDSKGDAPMLMLCGHRIAVRAKRGLRKALAGDERAKFEEWDR